ncbi:VOC family protein [Geodermatophilus sp. SYSU D00691]
MADRDRSLAFYTGIGYEVVGEVPDTPLGHLTMLKLPGDEFVTLELVHRPGERGADPGPGALSHLVVMVGSMDRALARLTAHGIDAEAPGPPADPDEIRTAWVTDPDGNRIELVQWPAGHADGLSAADWPD